LILPDTSAWVEFLRGTGSATASRLREAITKDQELATTEPVVMELLAGAATAAEDAWVRQLPATIAVLRCKGLADYQAAALIFRACRGQGHTISSMIDCLIAAVAIRTDAVVLHHDADFEAIAATCGLKLA
jgi:predicted nucleic acid-binding protein